MPSRNTKRLPADAKKLVGLSLALSASESRIEDRFWEQRISALLLKVFRNGNQATLEAALDHLQKNHPEAYSTLAELAEVHSESFTMTYDNGEWDAILIAAPVLAWTRYSIPAGPLKPAAVSALHTALQTHILASGACVAMAPYLYSIDQLPRHYIETYRLAQQLAQAAPTGNQIRINANNLPETSLILADPRFLLAVAAVPAGDALFRWQQEEGNTPIERSQYLKQWANQAIPEFAQILTGCELECLLPGAYYSACRDADERIRPHTLNTAVRYLEDTLGLHANELRAVISGFGEHRITEYRIGFTQRASNNVLYGVVWPLYDHDNSNVEDAEIEGGDSPLDDIIGLLKTRGVTDIRRHPNRFEPEYCDDCGTPLYADPFGEVVHAEMPEEAESAQPRFH